MLRKKQSITSLTIKLENINDILICITKCIKLKENGFSMTAQKKKLDIFKLLEAVDKRDINFYSNLTPEEKKGFAPIVAMRWLSAVKGRNEENEYYLHVTNDRVNKHMWNSDLSKHPELIYKTMALCGLGKKMGHEWIKGFSREKQSKFVEFLKVYYPTASKNELEYLIQINSAAQLTELVNDSGLQDDEIKVLVKEIKELKK